MNTIRGVATRCHLILAKQFGLDFAKLFRMLRVLPFFVNDRRKFRKQYAGKLGWMPCLHDRLAGNGMIRNEYFWLDLLVAQRINEAKPQRHVDVGSRLDGFVAHVASFRKIDVLDIRPLATSVPNVEFKQCDLMQSQTIESSELKGCCDSLSCLHALEHFGLGRYGDPIDPHGYEKGMVNMAAILRARGVMYLGVPLGRERVEFNSHRIFDPRTIIRIGKVNGLNAQRLTVVNPMGVVDEISLDPESLHALAQRQYCIGIFVFIKS